MRTKLGHFVDISFSIQTNGYFLSNAWVSTILKNRIEVGISIDGKPDVQDKFRITTSGKPSSSGIAKTVKKLQTASAERKAITIGVISVVDADADIFGAMEYFEKQLEINGVNFLLKCDVNGSSILNNDGTAKYSKVLQDIFDASLLHESIYSHELQTLYSAIKGKPRYNYNDDDGIICYPAISISMHTDGSFGIDDSLITVGAWYKSLNKFNINTSSISEWLNDPDVLAYHREYFSIPDDCKQCKFAKACSGGLPHFRFIEPRGFNNRSIFCESYMSFYEHATNVLVDAGYPADKLWSSLRED